ncbi:hypothetical protein CANCADRAFT_30752 [Tortispora caseinolytica NRRL Y-17796]|uniref:Vacuolar protein sorting-associated protein 51 homolog n=1 Tax=Tortispora caseinolytica NRRL Y-17796 TaxID=767744 RepID=A0A1E4TLQ7_9ASCO|nr:hypothetical protein CANCADRAFT_30752 [Tortispora caseinolytica NRRL Y-17796]
MDNPSLADSTVSSSRKAARRSALREYYRNKKTSEVPVNESEIDRVGSEAYLEAIVRQSDSKQLLRHETDVIRELKALESERKTLVYDNYSKLIQASDVLNGTTAQLENNVEAKVSELFKALDRLQDSCVALNSANADKHVAKLAEETLREYVKGSDELANEIGQIVDLRRRIRE